MDNYDIQALLIDVKAIEKKLRLLLAQTCPCTVPDVLITSTPTSICSGGSVTLGTLPEGCNTYQWQILVDVTWTDIPGETSRTLTVTPETESTYRLLEYNKTCVGTSNEITVTPVAVDHLVFDSSDDTTICDGGVGILFAETVGCDGGTLTYQWQSFINGVWTDIPGATDLNYTTPALAFGGGQGTGGAYEYRLEVFCNGCGGVYSDGELITVAEDPVITISAESAEICEGGNTTIFSSVLGGGDLGNTYQWRKWIGGEWVDIFGANGADYITEVLDEGLHQYTLRVTQDSGCDNISNQVNITVVPDPVVTISADNDTIMAGGSFTLSSVVSGGSGTTVYQWEWFNGGIWNPIFTANSATFLNTDFGAPWNPIGAGSYLLRLAITQNPGCDVYSNEITITVT